MSGSRILVIAEPEAAARLAGVLRGGDDAWDVAVAGNAPLAMQRITSTPPDVIVLTATLEGEGTFWLCGEIKAQLEPDPPIVLLGDDTGPVRTALDAMEFGAARFVKQPVSPKALVFAVKSCLGTATVRPVTVGGLGGVVGESAGRAAGVAEALAEVRRGDEDTGAGADAGGVALHALDAAVEAAVSDAVSSAIDDAVNDVLSLASLSGPDPVEVDSGWDSDSAAPDLDEEPPAAASPEPDPPPAPAWREPTQILSGGQPPPAPPEPEPEPPPARHVPELQAPPDEPGIAGDGSLSQAGADTIVRNLKKKMSDIEQRLFGTGGDTGDLVDEPAPEIDLDKIGVDTVPGLADVPADIEDEPTQAGPERPSAPVTESRVELAGEDAAFLLARLYRESFTGRVHFRRAEAQKSIYFEEGRPVFATSNLPHDRMGDLLYREGKITRAQHQKSREMVAETGRRMGEILVEAGFLKRRELLPAVRRHVEDITYSLFAWEDGEVGVVPGETAEEERIRLTTHPIALVLEGIRRKMALHRLVERLGPLDLVVAPLKRDEISAALVEADLAAEELRAAELFDGHRTLADVVKASGLDETSVYHLAYGLVALGLARAYHEGEETSPGAHTAHESVTNPPAAGDADLKIDRERVLAKHALVNEADYFAVLGVKRDATAFEIKRAYEAARRDYAVESFAPDLHKELAEPLREIAQVLDEAFQVLRDDELRGRYLENLQE